MKTGFHDLLPDAALVRAALARRPQAFEALIARYQKKAEAVVLAIGVRPEALPDVLQEALLRGFRNLSQLRKPDSFRSWFLQIVRNLARRSLRDKGRVTFSSELVPEEGKQMDEAGMNEVHAELWRAVDGLREGVREAICLYYYEGESVKAVAKVLGISRSAAKDRLHRGRVALRAKMWRRFQHVVRELVPTVPEQRHRARKLSLLAMAMPPSGSAAGGKQHEPALPSGEVVSGGGSGGGILTMSAKKVLVLGFALLGILAVGVAVIRGDGSPEREMGGATIPGKPALAADTDSPGRGQERVPDVAMGNRDEARTAEDPIPPAFDTDVQDKEREIEHHVKGKVVYKTGEPLEGAGVFVVGETDPFEREHPTKVGHKGRILFGHPVMTLEDGSYEARFSGPRRVLVLCFGTPGARPTTSEGQWVDTPAEGVDFSMERMPTATVIVRVIDLSDGKRLSSFQCGVQIESGSYSQRRAEGEEVEFTVRLPVKTVLAKAVVSLINPPREEGGTREISLSPGDRVEVEFGLPEEAAVSGQVTDAHGAPIAGALVYVGDQIRARGDEPFKPFEPDRIPDGDWTDSAGQFTVQGDGTEVTAWHPDYTPVTVAVEDSGQITLPFRGDIRGRLVDAEGAPMVGTDVILDRTRAAQTDEGGEFTFDKVEAGTRGLFVGPGRTHMLAVKVEPEETAQVDIAGMLPEVRVEVRAGDASFTEPLRGGLIGLGGVSTIHQAQVMEGEFTVRGILPGRYIFGSSRGHLAELDVQGPQARVDLGDAGLTVHASPGQRICIIPGDADELFRLMSLRVVRVKVPDSGVVRFAPLPPGKYVVGAVEDDRLRQETPVEVSGPDTEVELK